MSANPMFDLDDLLGPRQPVQSAAAPPPPPGSPPQSAPSANTDDVFGFPPAAPAAPQYYPPAGPNGMPPHGQPPQAPMPSGYPSYPSPPPPQQQQQQQQPPQQPVQPGYTPPYGVQAPVSQPMPTPQTYGGPASELERQGSSVLYASAFGAPNQAPAGDLYPPSNPHQTAMPPSAPAPLPPVGSNQAASPSRYSEEEDRLNLERIKRLRQKLEEEQAAEAAATRGATYGGGAAPATGVAGSMSPAVAGPPVATPVEVGWSCPKCTFQNKNSDTRCEMCEVPRPGFASSAPAPQPPQQQQQQQSPPPPSGGGSWTCDMCQGQNQNSAICRICNSPKPVPKQSDPQPPAGGGAAGLPPNVWACANCTLHNPMALPKCQACGYARPGAGPLSRQSAPSSTTYSAPTVAMPSKWSCSQCTFENEINASKCSMCESARPEHITVQIQQAQQQEQQRASADSADALPLTINGRRLTADEQQRLVNQQRELLNRIQSGGQSAATTAGANSAPPNDVDSDSDDENAVQWQKDADAKRCTSCDAGFGLIVRRHHCRVCGFVYCKNCCNNFIKLKPTNAERERTCNACFREKTAPAPAPAPSRPAAVPSTRSVVTPPPTQALAAPTAPTVRAHVVCDCVAAAEGFHRPGCPNNRGHSDMDFNF